MVGGRKGGNSTGGRAKKRTSGMEVQKEKKKKTAKILVVSIL
jgi:hypothetical protein